MNWINFLILIFIIAQLLRGDLLLVVRKQYVKFLNNGQRQWCKCLLTTGPFGFKALRV